MNKPRIPLYIKIIIYVLGCFFIAFGVVMMLISNIGLSSFDTLHYSLSKLFPITIGTAVIIVAALTTLFIIIAKKNLIYLFMAIPIVIVGGLIDLLNLVILKNVTADSLGEQLLFFASGELLLPLGGSLLLLSTFPAGVFDELTLVFMKFADTKNFMVVRVIIEVGVVVLALITGVLAGIGLGMISYGTIIHSLIVGVILHTYLKLFERLGLYESQ